MVRRCAIGVDIGGTKVAAGVVTADGAVRWVVQRPTPVQQGVEAIGQQAAELAREASLRAAQEGYAPVGVGLAVAGQVDVRQQRIVGATRRFEGWERVPLKAIVERVTGLPATMDNDAKAAARAELRWGAARGARFAIVVTLGTGVGGALVVEGRVVDGARGLAGHIGHIPVQDDGPTCACGRTGCVELYAAAPGIVSVAAEAAGPAVVLHDAGDVWRAAEEGQPWAQLALGRAAESLGMALAGLVHALDPEVIVIGGGLSAWGESWRSRIERAVGARVMPAFSGRFEVRLAAYGPQAGIAGAGALVLEQVEGGDRHAPAAGGTIREP